MKRRNAAATDLWSQLLAQAITDPRATIMDPLHDESEDRRSYREGMAAAGWSSAQIDAMEKAQQERERSAPTTSPGVARSVEALMAILADDVEAAMERLGLQSHAQVARGVEPRVGPWASKIGVIMTDESIVTVGSFLFRFCGLVARAFTRTLRLHPWLWDDDIYTIEAGLAQLRHSPDVVTYWMKIYLSFAMTGTHIGAPRRLSTPHEVVLMEQIARAMEIFAVAHEYGHHHLLHRNPEDDAQLQEFEADQFALRICDEADRRPLIIANPYLVSGAGGVVLLMALETLRSMENVLGAPLPQGKTHPDVAQRIAKFQSVRLLQPVEFKRLRSFRIASTRIMALIHEVLMPAVSNLPPEQLSRMCQLRDQIRSNE